MASGEVAIGQIEREYQEFGFGNTKFEMHTRHLNRNHEERAECTNLYSGKWSGLEIGVWESSACRWDLKPCDGVRDEILLRIEAEKKEKPSKNWALGRYSTVEMLAC